MVNSKGTDRRRLVANGFSNIQPDWSPGGNKIAFASDHGPGSNMDIWIVDREGKNLRQITFNKALDYDPNWAPNGSQICFTSTRSGKMAIWIIDVISRNAKPLFSNSLSPESKEPDWSPGGVAR
ncbi:MAG: TolB family protein [Planctomycetota bacterium]